MVGFSKHLLVAAAACAVVQAHPRGGFQFTSLNSAWAVKRALYNLDAVSDQDHKDKLTQGLKDAITIAAKTLEKMDDEQHLDKLEYWFGDQHSDANGREQIRQVYKNFVGENTDGTGADVNGDVIVDDTDYWKPKAGQAPNADGQTPFCSLEQDGKTGTAYFKRHSDKKPGMHFCDKVWSRDNLAGLLADDCSALSGQVSTATWSKNFIGSNVLHEFMHYPKIGQEALGTQITDWKYDAFQCRALAVNDDVNERTKTLTNADTYVWYALHIAFTELCGKSFSGPRNERDDDPTNQDWPDSDPEEDAQTDTCNCDENGCAPDSPTCCANGTC
ncbi:hypothetical protein COCMIDRAFT_7299 [Bipolaris oryzae ATCC 44560]|uniref:Peptidase domain-containing protein n=1 Tax=Bipolaris oryzae ATCC 44560 TaxID=930090 RepID=W6YUZ6_COCMI|nr:uncharacterized protein COCMIDRAFT_7299 [Bipolaris oryzae ATCC 44560]EUC43262.1 hypothetical protein COCMIDRAFT_7299 [Bipolaris oryzae ATCC 44560]